MPLSFAAATRNVPSQPRENTIRTVPGRTCTACHPLPASRLMAAHPAGVAAEFGDLAEAGHGPGAEPGRGRREIAHDRPAAALGAADLTRRPP
jgi:hypothetical protein